MQVDNVLGEWKKSSEEHSQAVLMQFCESLIRFGTARGGGAKESGQEKLDDGPRPSLAGGFYLILLDFPWFSMLFHGVRAVFSLISSCLRTWRGLGAKLPAGIAPTAGPGALRKPVGAHFHSFFHRLWKLEPII